MIVVPVPVNDVIVPVDRIREEFDPDAIEELKASMSTIGQLHPIIIERDNALIAGHRRLLVARALGWSEIHAVYKEDLDPLTRKIIEYDENRRRSALTWQEDAKAIAEIHTLKLEQDQSWTLQKTADELGISVAKVHEDIALATVTQATPNPGKILDASAVHRVMQRPTRTGALITMKREKEVALVRELARRQQATTPTEQRNNLHHGNAHEIMATLAADSVDLIVTDPPWLIDVGQSSQVAKLKSAGYEDINDDDVLAALADCYRVLKPGCHMYCFVSGDDLHEWDERIRASGMVTRRRPLIWVKENWHGISDPYRRFMTGYDCILWSFKPDDQQSYRNFNIPVHEVMSMPPVTSWHSAAKPVDLIKTWVEASSVVNEVVFDPFAGSGSTLIAAVQTGRRYIGVEKDKATWVQTSEDLKNISI
jgi:ParB/RepB/Spo0J family partition protein